MTQQESLLYGRRFMERPDTKAQRYDPEDLARAIARAEPDFDETQERVALATYRRLAHGSPATAEDIARAADVPADLVERLLGSWTGVFRDRSGGVVGFWGLTLRRLIPTHGIEVAGKQLFTWCAWDTLFLPGLLAATLDVRSTCPTTGETVSLVASPTRVQQVSHPGMVVSFLVPDTKFGADVIHSFCHFVHFFVSRDAGERWTREHPGTFLLTLEEAFEVGQTVNALNFPSVVGVAR